MAILVAGSNTGDVTELIAPNHKIKELTLFTERFLAVSHCSAEYSAA